MIMKWSQSGHRTSGNEPIGLDSRSDATTPSKPVTCRNAIIGGTRGHAKTPNFGSSNPTSTANPTTEVQVGPANGLDHACVVSCDNIVTVPVTSLGHQVGFLLDAQETALTQAIHAAFDLD